jgi:hypothetical protein
VLALVRRQLAEAPTSRCLVTVGQRRSFGMVSWWRQEAETLEVDLRHEVVTLEADLRHETGTLEQELRN